MARVVDLNNTPGVLTSANLTTANLNDVLRADNSKRHESAQLGVLLDGVLIILINIIREVVDGDSVVLNILHDQLLRLGQLGGSKGVGTANDGDDVDTGSKALHKFDVEFSETVAGGSNEVEHGMYTVVPESRVTLDSGLLSQNIVVLSLEVANNFREAAQSVRNDDGGTKSDVCRT